MKEGTWRKRKALSVDGRLLSTLFLFVSSQFVGQQRRKEIYRLENGGECGRMESQGDARETMGERDPRDANEGYERESCEALRRMARLRGCETI